MMKITVLFIALLAMPALAKPYPQNAQRAFMHSCAGFSRDLIEPCRCVLKKLEEAIPYQEFEVIIASSNAMENPRVAAATRQCIGDQ